MNLIHCFFPWGEEEIAAAIYQQTKSNVREGGGLSSAGKKITVTEIMIESLLTSSMLPVTREDFYYSFLFCLPQGETGSLDLRNGVTLGK